MMLLTYLEEHPRFADFHHRLRDQDKSQTENRHIHTTYLSRSSLQARQEPIPAQDHDKDDPLLNEIHRKFRSSR
ncbi:DEKNAAC105210 [Brettanomyces naardenensis]|uniref:DEKNAAC105210 n=1 Tax=Brettanomyces naardenensis TaxID=13370 RepID=A0A448YT16_BRENA|nr:DEKNAAC105210 [Brettanomyces naardenensis]